MEKGHPLRTSYSALQTFKQCPQKYKFQAIDKIRAPKSKEAVFGNIIHDTLKFLHSKYPVSPTLDELLNYYKDIWDSEPFQSQEEDMIYFSEGIRMLKSYYQHFLKNKDKFTVLDTESRFEIPIKHPETKQELNLVGKIDRIDKLQDGTIRVIDYKTAKRLPSQAEADRDLQFSLYCLAVFLRWPNLKIKNSEDIKLSFYYLRHGEALTTKRTRAQLEEAKNEAWQRINEIEKGNFKPLPSALCDWCGYKKICPMWKNLYKKQIDIDDEQIKKIINEFFELKGSNSTNNKRIKELQEIIKQYLDKEKIERVFSDEGYITRLIQVRHSYDMDKIKKALGPMDKWRTKKEYTVLKITPKKQRSNKN